MKIEIALLSIILCIYSNSFASPIKVTQKRCDFNKYDNMNSFEKLKDGGYVLTGYRVTSSNPTISDSIQRDLIIWKLDENFDTLFCKKYGLRQNEAGADIIETSNKELVIGGMNSSYSSQVWMIKLNQSGDSIWSKSIGNYEAEFCNCICEFNDGSFGIAGTKVYGSNNINDYYVLRVNVFGDTIWTKRFFYSENAEAKSCVFQNGRFITAGYAPHFRSPYGTGSDALIVEFNTNGDTVWTRKYNTDFINTINMIERTNDNGNICIGSVTSPYPWQERLWILRIDQHGDTLWSKEFFKDITPLSQGIAIRQLRNGGFAAIGNILLNNKYYSVILKLNENGDSVWSTYSNCSNHCWAKDLVIDSSGMIVGLFTEIHDHLRDTLILASDNYLITVDESSYTNIKKPNPIRLKMLDETVYKYDLAGRLLGDSKRTKYSLMLVKGKKQLDLKSSGLILRLK